MSFHKAELAKLETTGGAAWRKYQRLMAEAHGAQHGSPAEMAKTLFEHAWVADPSATKYDAEVEEGARLRPVAPAAHPRSKK